ADGDEAESRTALTTAILDAERVVVAVGRDDETARGGQRIGRQLEGRRRLVAIAVVVGRDVQAACAFIAREERARIDVTERVRRLDMAERRRRRTADEAGRRV